MSHVTVLGSCGAWPEPGRACSGFLLGHNGLRIVLDLGYGTVARLLTALDSTVADGLDAAAIAQAFDWQALPGPAHDVGPFTLRSVDLPHFVPNAGVHLDATDLAVASTGDTGPDTALADLGRDVDLFVVEATDRAQQPGNDRARSRAAAREGYDGEVLITEEGLRLDLP